MSLLLKRHAADSTIPCADTGEMSHFHASKRSKNAACIASPLTPNFTGKAQRTPGTHRSPGEGAAGRSSGRPGQAAEREMSTNALGGETHHSSS
jgi:hypothetical protein